VENYRWTWTEIDLDALRHNLEQFRSALDPRIALMAVVKANAYGHGAVKVAKEAISFGVHYLAVAFLDEALELRHHGIEAPILVLGYTSPEGVEAARRHNITLTAFDDALLEAAAADLSLPPLKVHVKIDTGMGRIGLTDAPSAIRYIERALSAPGIEVEGLFTHYARADEHDKSHVLLQHRRFTEVVEHFAQKQVQFRYIHAGNSATAIDTPELTCTMARLGVAMYGMYPSDEVDADRVKLRPVMSFKTRVVMVKKVPAGTTISYGAKYAAKEDGETIATLPVGYADGFTRMLSGKAEVLLRGRRVPVVGNICMDQCMIRVDNGEAAVGDEVVIFGSQGEASILADELADQLGTINYEITCMLSHRVPRVYLKHGDIVEVDNTLLHFTNGKSISF